MNRGKQISKNQKEQPVQYKAWNIDLFNYQKLKLDSTWLKIEHITNTPYVLPQVFSIFKQCVSANYNLIVEDNQRSIRQVAQCLAFKKLSYFLDKKNKIQNSYKILCLHPQQQRIGLYLQNIVNQYLIQLQAVYIPISFQKTCLQDIIKTCDALKSKNGSFDLIVLGQHIQFSHFKKQQTQNERRLAEHILIICKLLADGQHAIIKIASNLYQRTNQMILLLTTMFQTITIFRPFSVHPCTNIKYLLCHSMQQQNSKAVYQFLLNVIDNKNFDDFEMRLIQKLRMLKIMNNISNFNKNFLSYCMIPGWQKQADKYIGEARNNKQIYKDFL